MDKEVNEKERLSIALKMSNTAQDEMRQKVLNLEHKFADRKQMVADMERDLNAARKKLSVS